MRQVLSYGVLCGPKSDLNQLVKEECLTMSGITTKPGFLKALLSLSLVFALAGAAVAGQDLKLEPNHSSIGFQIPIAGGITKVRGSFSSFDVKINWDKDDITKSTVTAEIEASSISTANADRDNDLRTEQFFDVENHPKIIFTSTQIKKNGKGYIAIGDLTMRGVTREVQLDFVVNGAPGADQRYLGISISGSLNRQDFGVGSSWKHSLIENFIGDIVKFEMDLWAKPPKAKKR